jgi:hypothetical protein
MIVHQVPGFCIALNKTPGKKRGQKGYKINTAGGL